MSVTVDGRRYDWRPYYRFSMERPPRDMLHRSIKRFEQPGFAVDLGCGAGTDGLYMLSRGWRVLAIDQQEQAIEMMRENVRPEDAGRLEMRVASYRSLALPQVDLVWAGLSLPFCRPADFGELWAKIRGALREGGRFAGDFFGPRHAWAESEKMIFHSREEVLALCEGLEMEYFVEEEGEVKTADQGMQHWHMFTVCVRKV